MRMMRFLIVLFAALVVLPLATVSPAAADEDIYITEGSHHVGGREWRTHCEPYSATRRCWTEIIATTVTHEGGHYVRSTGWTFNNLTYAASPRSLWTDNPLGAYGRVGGIHEWTADDGRQWRTECDTAATGGNGCRSYVLASVVEADGAGPAARFQTVRKFVFNSMVRFLPAPPKVSDPLDRIVDPGLRACVAEAMVQFGAVDAISSLWCDSRGIKTLRGFPAMPRLTDLDLADNALTSLAGLPALPRLESLSVNDNGLTTLTGLPSLPALTWLDASVNALTSLTGLAAVPRLEALDAWGNRLGGVLDLGALPRGVTELNLSRNALTRVTGSLPGLDRLLLENNRIVDAAGIVAGAPRVTILDLGGNLVADAAPLARLGSLQYLNLRHNRLTTVAGLTKLPKLMFLYLHENQITSVNGLQHLPLLEELFLAKNGVQDLQVLKPLRDRGCTIDIWP